MKIASAERLWFLIIVCVLCAPCTAQTSAQKPPASESDRTSQPSYSGESSSQFQAEEVRAREELQKGTALTRQGKFNDAIPHLLAAQQVLRNEYAIEFNLSLCYVGIGDYKKAIPILDGLRRQHDNANVENLLAQAYVGDGQDAEALAAVERATSISPQDEKLFTFVADACMDRQEFEFGLRVIDLGLARLPRSARLHYARATLLSELDQLDRAKEDFAQASELGRGTEIGYLAAAQQNMLEGNIDYAIQIAREGIKRGIENSALLGILGKALLRSGMTPDQPEFNEAQTALEKSVSAHPNDASAQIALGQAFLLAGRFDDAIAHLDVAQRMKPNQPSIYASLAKAYQRKGDSQRAQESLQKLETLNQAQAERIRSAPGERKMSYGGSSPPPQ